MNNNYYPQNIPPIIPSRVNNVNSNQNATPNINTLPNLTNIPGLNNPLNNQESTEYVDNIFKLNIDKEATFYLSFSDSIEWRDKVFTGIIRDSGKDYVLLENNGTWTIIWMIYINFATFNTPINY